MNTQAIDRKPIFDAVRLVLGRGFNHSEVASIDRAIDRALGRDGDRPRLGKLSERFESGGRGPGAVSSGAGDPGGVSYGTYQLSSRAGTAAAFVGAEGAPWQREFGRAVPGSAAFSAAWKRIAEREPDAFAEAQHAFIRRTHYEPVVAAVRARTGLDVDVRHPAVRDAVWSMAVQHGGASSIIRAAIGVADAELPREDAGYDRRLVEELYAGRTGYVLRLARRSAAGRTLQSVARTRYPAELRAALAMFDERNLDA